MESNQPSATYQIAMLPLQHRTSFKVGMVGVEPTRSCSHDHARTVPGGPPLPYIPLFRVSQNGRTRTGDLLAPDQAE